MLIAILSDIHDNIWNLWQLKGKRSKACQDPE